MWSLCQTKAALLYYWISHKIENSYVVFFPFFSFLQHNAKGQTLFMFTTHASIPYSLFPYMAKFPYY